jgi:hypothetical protein
MVRKFGFLFFICSIVVSLTGCQWRSLSNRSAGAISNKQMKSLGSELSADCIVTIFGENGKKYITSQHHRIFPSQSAIIIEASEPQGQFQWDLINNAFATVKGASLDLPITVCDNEIAQAILLSVSAAGGFLGDQSGVMLNTTSIAGRIYQPIVTFSADSSPITLTVYRDTSSYDIDWVDVANSDSGILYAARNYNLRQIPDSDKLMPTSIDIYNTDKDGKPSDLVMTIDYNSYSLLSK